MRSTLERLIKYYTDHHDVDEDSMTIVAHGGYWGNATAVGIMYRDMEDTPTNSWDSVASYVCEHHLLTLDGYHNVGHKIPTDQLIHMYLYLYKFS